MMKKVWLVLLAMVLVFGLAVVGCSSGSSSGGEEGEEGEELVQKVVFDMATDPGIQALELGVIPNTAFAGDGNPLKPLVRAGEDAHITYEVVDNSGVKAIKFTTVADWGAGIDLRYATFGFRAGDVIKITGEFISGTGGRVQVNGKVGAENATIGGVDTRVTEVGTFEKEFTLTQDNVDALKAGGPAGLRIEGRPANIVAQINNITINGLRPSNLKALAAPVIEATATGVKWEAIEGAGGYKVFADDGEDPITTAGPSDTSANLAVLTSLADGTYSITVVATGISGASKDSAASNAVSFTKYTPPPPKAKVKVNSVDQEVEVVGVKTTVTLLEDMTGYSITYASGSDMGYGNAYAIFQVDLGASKKLSDVTSIKFTFKGESGDIGWKTISIIAFGAKPTGQISNDTIANSGAGYSNNGTTEATFTITDFKATNITTTNDIQKPYIVIGLWCENEKDDVLTKYTIKNIEILAQ